MLQLILVFPPVLHALTAANFDIDHAEEIFSPVSIVEYWSGAVRVATPYGDFFAGFIHESGRRLSDPVINLMFSIPMHLGEPRVASLWQGPDRFESRFV